MERQIGDKPRPSKAGEQQQAVRIPELPPLALPFVNEGLEQVRDSHC